MRTLSVVFYFSILNGYSTECCRFTSEYFQMVLNDLSIFDIDYSIRDSSFGGKEIYLKSEINDDFVCIIYDARKESERIESIYELEDMFGDGDNNNDDDYDYDDYHDYDPMNDPNEQNGQNTLEGGTGQWAHN